MKLIAKSLSCCIKFWILRPAGVDWKNRCSSKAKQMIFLKILYNSRVHISKLTAMALVKNDNDMLTIHLMSRIFLNKSRQFLNRCDNDFHIWIFQLSFQNHSRRIAVSCTLLKTIILLHRLIIQILTVNHKQYLINIWKLRGKPRRLKGSQRFSRTCRMPDITTALNTAILLIIICNFNAI